MSSNLHPRDRLDRIFDLGRKTLRYWWLVTLFALAGGALALVVSVIKPKNYVSWATLFYQERIQTQVMSPTREEVAQRNIGDRYRELLLARSHLALIVADPKLNPFADEADPEVAIDKLREQIKFEARGANAFRVTYKDEDPNRAKAVTERLTGLLQDKDEQLRLDQANRTVTFATQQKEAAATELRQSEQKLAEFLAKHPEFAQDSNQPNTEGAGIRAIRNQKTTPTGNPRLYALERQRQRIQARLDAPPDAPPIRILAPPSPERVAAEASASEARREVASATRQLDDAMSRYTERHPEVQRAKSRLSAAQTKLKNAEGAVPPLIETAVAPATKEDREKLERELAQLEKSIATAQQRAGAPATTAADSTTDWVVRLETDHANLRRDVNEQRERVEALASAVFRAQIDASQKVAEQGGRLTVVDPAFRPVRPSGPGKTIFLLAGLAVFLALGLGVAVGLAVIDDRVYHRDDLVQLGIPVLAVIPPTRGTRPTGPKRKPPSRRRVVPASPQPTQPRSAA